MHIINEVSIFNSANILVIFISADLTSIHTALPARNPRVELRKIFKEV